MSEDDSADLLALLAPGGSTPTRSARGTVNLRPPSESPRSKALLQAVPEALLSVPVAVRRLFHPVPGVPLVGPDGAITAESGTAVHAVVAGVVEMESGEDLRLQADDGLTIRYGGVAPGTGVMSGIQVLGGAVLGAIGAGARITIAIRDADGNERDAASFLLGFADPDGLGYAPTGFGVGLDPDALDRSLTAEVRP